MRHDSKNVIAFRASELPDWPLLVSLFPDANGLGDDIAILGQLEALKRFPTEPDSGAALPAVIMQWMRLGYDELCWHFGGHLFERVPIVLNSVAAGTKYPPATSMNDLVPGRSNLTDRYPLPAGRKLFRPPLQWSPEESDRFGEVVARGQLESVLIHFEHYFWGFQPWVDAVIAHGGDRSDALRLAWRQPEAETMLFLFLEAPLQEHLQAVLNSSSFSAEDRFHYAKSLVYTWAAFRVSTPPGRDPSQELDEALAAVDGEVGAGLRDYLALCPAPRRS